MTKLFSGTHFYLRNEWVENNENHTWEPQEELYEVFRVMDGIPIFLSDHLQRLNTFFETKHTKIPVSVDALSQQIQRLIEKNHLVNTNIRISFDLAANMDFAMGEVASYYPSAQDYITGVSSHIISAERTNPTVKVFQKEMKKTAQKEIEEGGYYDVILCNKSGELTEGSRTNLFFIKGACVYSSPIAQVLPGITRMKVLDICKAFNIPLILDKIHKSSLSSFDAAFFSGTSPHVLPISKIDDVVFDTSSEIMRLIMREFQKYVARESTILFEKMCKNQNRS